MQKDVVLVTLPTLPTILALDPGGTTGYCLYVPPALLQDSYIQQDELSSGGHYTALWGICEESMYAARVRDSQLVIVCEPFEFRRDDRDKDKIEYASARYEGVVNLFAQKFRDKDKGQPVTLVKQSASLIKARSKNNPNPPFWGRDERIKKIGLWIPGKPHAMDATRHFLYYVTFKLGDKRYLHMLK